VREDSPLRSIDEVDSAGVRVATATGSAYDLFLSRNLKSATILRAPGSLVVVDRFLAQGLEVAAGVRQHLVADARRLPGLRVLPGAFMSIRQALALPKGRGPALGFVAAFIEELKASGYIAAALQRHGAEGAAVAPPGSAATGA